MNLHSQKGSGLVEYTLAAPMLIVGFMLVVWFCMLGIETITATYAMFMGTRAASVTVPAYAGDVALAQAQSIFSRTLDYQRIAAPYKLDHVQQPYGASLPKGDNPLP